MLKKQKKEPKSIGGSNIEETLRSIQSRFGEGAIMTLNKQPKTNVDAVPSGSLGLDIALGVGGFPRGRIIEVYGPESSGKTTLALHVIAQAQKKGGLCAFIDAEHALDPTYAKHIGVKTDELLNKYHKERLAEDIKLQQYKNPMLYEKLVKLYNEL